MQALTKKELTSLLIIAHGENLMHWLMLLTAFSHGLRVSEVINLRKKDIQDGYITTKRLKGSLKTIQPLLESHDTLFDEKRWLQALANKLVDDEDKLFPVTRMTVWRYMQRYGTLAGIPKHKLHPHVLKHTCAMLSIKNAGVENVKRYLGHKSLSSTGEYLKVSDEEASSAIQDAFKL